MNIVVETYGLTVPVILNRVGQCMLRRNFLSLSAICGGLTALLIPRSGDASVCYECKDGHDLDVRYVKDPAISIGQFADRYVNTIVPCLRCGALFAIRRGASGDILYK